MKIYVIALAAGLLVGLIYALLHVRSPAPPVVALVGLLGMLIGEQSVPLVKRMLAREPITASWLRTHCVAQITGIPASPTDAGTSKGRADAPTAGKPHA